MEAARQQYEAAQERRRAAVSGAAGGARARVALARKALADTVVRAPFTGLVAERLVSVGDYVTKGMKVAVVVRVNPLRVQLTVPEQFVSGGRGRRSRSSFEVDAYPGPAVHGHGPLRVAGARSEPAALTVEAVVPNAERRAEAGTLRDRAASKQPAADAWRARPGRGRADHRRHQPRVRRQRRPRRGAASSRSGRPWTTS